MDKEDLVVKLSIIVVIITFSLIFSNLFKFTGFFLLTATNDSLETGNLSFNSVKNHTIYISLVKSGINVTSATVNLSGQKGLFTGDWFNLNETNTQPTGITMNDTFFWVADRGNSQIYVYDINGNYIQNWSSPVSPRGITQNGSNIWISGPANITYHDITGGLISSFVPTNCTKDVNVVDNNRGITSNSSNVFVITDFTISTTRICTYTHNGTHVNTQDFNAFTSFLSQHTKNFYTNSTYFWIVGGQIQSPSRASIIHKKNYSFGDIESYVTIYSTSNFTTTNLMGRGIAGNASNLFLVTYNFSDSETTPITPGRVYKMHMDPSFPNNTWLEVGTEDGIYEWQHTGIFNLTNNKTADFSARINNFLSICTADTFGNCSIPFKIHSDITGIIDYYGIKISYNDTQAPIVTLTPSTNRTDIGLAVLTAISCSATDNIGTPTITVSVAGSTFCTGAGSCSGNYNMVTSGDKTVTCQATDLENNIATKTIILTGVVAQSPPPAPGPGGGGGGGVTPPPEPTPVEEIEETLPLELTPEIEPILVEDITSEIKENSVIINLQERARLKLSFEEGPRPKPRLDIEFSTKEIPKLKQTIMDIKYVDWHYYFNIFLSVLIVILVVYNIFNKMERFK